MTTVNGIALFCEDIRPEVGGSVSLVGVMSDFIAVPSFPVTLAKLGFYARLFLPVEGAQPDMVVNVIEVEGGVVEIASFSETMIAKAQSEAKTQGNDYVGLIAQAVASPFTVNSPGHVIVELRHGTQITRLGNLNFSELVAE